MLALGSIPSGWLRMHFFSQFVSMLTYRQSLTISSYHQLLIVTKIIVGTYRHYKVDHSTCIITILRSHSVFNEIMMHGVPLQLSYPIR